MTREAHQLKLSIYQHAGHGPYILGNKCQLDNGFSYLFFYAVCLTVIFDISSTAVNMEETNQPLQLKF